MSDVRGHFFYKSRTDFPRSDIGAGDLVRRVVSLKENLDKLIEVRGDKDGKTVSGARILETLEIKLTNILSASLQKGSQSSGIDAAALDAAGDVPARLGQR